MPVTPLPGPSASSPTDVPSSRSARSAMCRLSPCSLWLIATRDSSRDTATTWASWRCSYSVVGCCPGTHRCTTVPSSVERPISARPLEPRARPAGYEGSRDGAAGSSAPPSNGWRIHTPYSSPSVSANHHTHAPVGSMVPMMVPLGRSVTWRVAPLERSHVYISKVPLALLR